MSLKSKVYATLYIWGYRTPWENLNDEQDLQYKRELQQHADEKRREKNAEKRERRK